MKGVTECHKLMQEHSEERKFVRMFIGSLTDKSIGVAASANANVTSLAMHAAMFGFLSQ
jgi:hypothetical protein